MREQKARAILLVEDNEDDRLRIQRLLRGGARRYDIASATNGHDALELLHDAERRFDCVLLDYHLPDLDGLEFFRSLRDVAVAVTVLTGRDDDELAARILEAGAEDYLLKDGLTAHALTRSIENVI